MRKPTRTLEDKAMSHLAWRHIKRNTIRMGGTNLIQRQMLAICTWEGQEKDTQSTAGGLTWRG